MARLDELPTGEDKPRRVRSMFDAIAPRYDLVNRVMTFGMDVGWRRRTVAALDLDPGALVLDVACGTGDLCRELQASGYRAVGLDFAAGMLAAAKTTAPLVQADALALPVKDRTADGVTCGFALRNVADVTKLFGEFGRVVRPGGRVAILEVAHPESRLLRAGHHFYFHRVVPLIGGLLSDRSAYGYLPRSTAYLPERDELLGRLGAVGFDGVASKLLRPGAAQVITGTRR